jgi:hypothetical protein
MLQGDAGGRRGQAVEFTVDWHESRDCLQTLAKLLVDALLLAGRTMVIINRADREWNCEIVPFRSTSP